MTGLVTIPARRGQAAFLMAGQEIQVINTHGEQVIDTWAFNRDDMSEFLSCEHTRATLKRLIPRPGDALLSNRRRPILTLLEDTSGGVHDMLMAACDRYRYEELGCPEYHDNCTDNLAQALRDIGLASVETPSPLNLFMNIPWTPDGRLSFDPPVSTPGSYVVLRTEMNLLIAFSACPQDILPINGAAGTPTEAHFTIRGSGSNRTESAFQSLNEQGLLARDKCMGLCTLNPSKSQAVGKPSAIRIKGRLD